MTPALRAYLPLAAFAAKWFVGGGVAVTVICAVVWEVFH